MTVSRQRKTAGYWPLVPHLHPHRIWTTGCHCFPDSAVVLTFPYPVCACASCAADGSYVAPSSDSDPLLVTAAYDVYAVGIIMWQMYTGHGSTIYPGRTKTDLPAAVVAGERPAFPSGMLVPYRDLAMQCLAADPRRRPTASALVEALSSALDSVKRGKIRLP